MKLLLFTYEFPPVPGGIGRYCATLSRTLLELGHEVVVVIPKLIKGAGSEIADAKVVSLRRGFYRNFDNVIVAMAGRVCTFAEEGEIALV